MPESENAEISKVHKSKAHPYEHVDIFVRDSVTDKKVRKISDGNKVE